MRIQLLDPNLIPISDRLVVQETEFMIEPKDIHEGPMRIEFNLHSQGDVEKCKAYLDKLVGKIPLGVKKSYAKKTSSIVSKEDVNFSNSVTGAMTEANHQDDLIKALRESGFTFLSSQYLEELSKEDKIKWTWKKEVHKDFQFMVPQTKRGKTPASDKYDFTVAVGFSLNTKAPGIIIYELGKYDRKVKLGWKKFDAPRLKKKAMTVFPKFMTEQDRERYRLIQRKSEDKIDLTAAEDKFYTRWEEWVKAPADN